ncbi:MAG: hypothetical protein ACRDIA_06345 [Actinomycetota bacterium]
MTAACGQRVEEQGTGGTVEKNSVEEVRELLRRRASALIKGDRKGFLAPLSEQTLQPEAAIFDGAQKVPLAEFGFIFSPEKSQSLHATKFTDVETHVTFRYRGLPEDNLFFFTVIYDLEKTEQGWRITGADRSPKATPPPWVTGPVATRETRRFLVLHRPGLQRVDEAIALAEEARTDVTGKLTLVPDTKYLLVLAADGAQFSEFEGEAIPDGVLALAGFSQGGAEVPRNRYLLVNMAQTLQDPSRKVATHSGDVSPIQVFRHELGHLALLRYTTSVTSGWVIEGAAMYLSGEARSEAWRDIVRREALDEINIYEIAPHRNLPGAAYPYANAAVLHLVDAYGSGKFWEFYRSFKRLPSGGALPGDIAAASQQQLKRVYGLTEPELDSQTRKWIFTHAA